MKQKKRELSLYSTYDFTGIARHLEDMTHQGWQLEKIGTFWTYRRCEPSDTRYAVVYFANASDLDSGPSQEQQDFWAMCQTAGWQLVANRGQTQIFQNPDPEAIPIETDPVVQVDNIHTSMKKGLFIPNLVVLACSLLQVILQCARADSIRDFLESPFPLSTLLIWGTLGIHCGWDILSYLRWHRKARSAAREEGILLSPKSSKWRQVFLLAVCAVYVLFLVSSAVGNGNSQTGFALLYGVGYAIVLGGSIRGSQWLMKKKGVSPTTNRVLSCVIGIVAGMVCLFGMVKLVMNGQIALQLQGHANAETVTYTSLDGSRAYTYDFYRDDLPLTVEDLLGAEPDSEYSRRLDVSGTPLLTKYAVRQQIPYYGDRTKPDLSYTVWEVRLDCLYEPVKASFFEELTKQNKKYSYQERSWKPIGTALWGALDAYQYYRDGEPCSAFLLCYADRFVEIHDFDGWNGGAPTTEQMALVGEALGTGPLT